MEFEHKTIQYRLNTPNALHTISPALAALHASRVVALHPEIAAILAPSHCPKCGTYHFSGAHSTPLIRGPTSTRKKRKRDTSLRPKSFQRSCHSCGFSFDACTSPSLDHPSAPIQVPNDVPRTGVGPAIQPTNETGRVAPPTDTPRRSTETKVAPPAPPRQSKSQSKPSHAKNSALRDMLSRDRQRQDAGKGDRKRKQGHEGLAAFLKEL